MKTLILICSLFSCVVLNASAKSTPNDFDWVANVMMKKLGSCQTHDLNFRALRFTKISLQSNLFLRVILFLRPNNSVAVRLTTQELLGCQTSSSGTEVCSYRPLTNSWSESLWSMSNNEIYIGALGLIHGDLTSNVLSLSFAADFPIAEIANSTHQGSMVAVNFDDRGVNTQKLCQEIL